MFGGINPRHAPAPWLPLPFLLSGPLALTAAHMLLWLRAGDVVLSYRAIASIAVAHLLVLGCITATMMGALYQMTPVIFVAHAPNPWLGLGQGTLYLAGWLLMVTGFLWHRTLALAVGGACVVVAVLLFLAIITTVLRTATQWDIAGWYVLAALVGLVATVVVGLTFALDWRFGWFPIPPHLLAVHVHLGGVGWLTLLIMGVSYRLVPMFAIAPAPTGTLARWNLGVLVILLIALATLLLMDAPRVAVAVCACGLAVAVGMYLYDMCRLYATRRRRFDLTIITMWGAMTCLAGAALMGALASTGLPQRWGATNPWLLTYAYLALAGWCGLAICAHLIKIVPFLVWLARYGSGMGRRPVPLLRDLLPQRLAAGAIAAYAAGMVITAGGLLGAQPFVIHLGAILAVTGAMSLFIALVCVLLPHRHSTRVLENQTAYTSRVTATESGR